MMYTNADTLTTKMRELNLLVNNEKIDVLLVTEVKPKYSLENVTKQQFEIEGYELFPNVEADMSHRGINIYVTDHLATLTHEIVLSENFKESVWIETKLGYNDKTIIGCAYRMVQEMAAPIQ